LRSKSWREAGEDTHPAGVILELNYRALVESTNDLGRELEVQMVRSYQDRNAVRRAGASGKPACLILLGPRAGRHVVVRKHRWPTCSTVSYCIFFHVDRRFATDSDGEMCRWYHDEMVRRQSSGIDAQTFNRTHFTKQTYDV
jgi:hypothetical protein